MSDFEILSIVFLVMTLVVAAIAATKNNRPQPMAILTYFAANRLSVARSVIIIAICHDLSKGFSQIAHTWPA